MSDKIIKTKEQIEAMIKHLEGELPKGDINDMDADARGCHNQYSTWIGTLQTGLDEEAPTLFDDDSGSDINEAIKWLQGKPSALDELSLDPQE